MDTIGTLAEKRRIGVLANQASVIPGAPVAVEPMRAANLLGRRTLYDVVNIGISQDPVPSSGAAVVMPQATIHDDLKLDYLFIVAGGNPAHYNERPIFPWLLRLARSGTRLGGVSGGPLILARAGLMNGRRMTVHWEHAEALAERFPETLIERRLFVMDRDRVTCGGGTAPLDMMHALISSQWGSVFARLVSDWFLHTDVRAAAAPQRGGLPERLGSHSPHLVEAVAAMENHIADPLSLPQLALIAGITPRHLNRLFTERLGQSAMAYYRELRLDVARRLIKDTAMSVAEIAETTGFATPGHFSNAYKASFGIRPQADRKNLTNAQASY